MRIRDLHHIHVIPKTFPKPFVRAQQQKANRDAGAVGIRRKAQKAKWEAKKQLGRRPGNIICQEVTAFVLAK